MLRSPWFWIVVILIAAGTAVAAVLGVLHWLALTFAAFALTLVITLLVAAYPIRRAKPPQIPHLRALPASERLPVIYDCDVTMGRLFREVDDGLVLLYLLGEPRVNLLSVTTTYGNGPVKMTTRTARELLNSVGHADIPVLRGAAGPDDDAEANEAAQHLRDIVNRRPGEITLVATGSMTNLKHAAALDADFFKKLRGLYLMGGVIEPLIWNGRRLAELNFALDPEAAYQAAHADCPITIASGQSGLSAVFRGPQLAALQAIRDPVSRLISRQVRSWFALMRLYFRDGGFALWDSVTALMLTQPGLFEYERVHVISTRGDLHAGRLVVTPNKQGPVRIVRCVLDYDRFINVHFAAWHHLGQQVEARRKL
ncbi:MAG: nucleoside hydrolase [Anaerolineae bacterium]|jgi:purine nucleosidase|nr:nucleoside hydrolase [Anaerolineae bacterium]